MVSVMKKLTIKTPGNELQNWGKAELMDKWVILHRKGGPKWAIYYREKSPKLVIPYRVVTHPKKRKP
ncbi:MAG: hypothetical protein JSW00_10825 [Thermoplasmata archaeon]|nr:MAG: hypothetical protein JSW00_10825 [Thermoplasmata archaeon]